MFSRITRRFVDLKDVHKLTIILLFGLVLRIIFFTGTGTSDELNYYHYANAAAHGDFSIEINHFSFRLGIIYPTALLFLLFGANELTSNLIAILASLGGIVLIYLLGKEFFGKSTGFIAAFLLAIFPLDVFYSTRLLPEIPAVFFMGLAVLFFIRGEKSGAWVYYLESGISFGLAYLMKETSLLLLLFFGAYCLAKRRLSPYYFLVGIGLATGIGLLLLASFIDTGNMFFQYQSNTQEEIPFLKENYPNYFTFEGRLIRLFLYTPYTFLTSPYLGLFFFPATIAAAYFTIKRNKKSHTALLWSIPLLLYMNFGTISFSEFVPFPLEVRHFSFVTYPLLILLAALLNERAIIKWKTHALVLLIALSLTSLIFLQDTNQADAIKEAYRYLKDNPSIPIYTDERTALVLEYLYGFNRNMDIGVFDRITLDTPFGKQNMMLFSPNQGQMSYVVIHSHLEGALRINDEGDLRPFSSSSFLPAGWKLEQTITNKEGTLFIYLVQ